MAASVPRTPAGLADAIDAFVAALGTPAGLAASGLTAADMSALTRSAAGIRTRTEQQDTAERAYRAAVRARETAHDAAEDLYRPARREAANSRAMTPELLAAAGIAGPVAFGGAGTLPTVADLTALPRPSGSVFLDWTGPTGGALRYEVFEMSLDDDGGTWTLIGSASATDFTHRDAVPGARSSYRVEAVRGERRGEPSNEAAVHA